MAPSSASSRSPLLSNRAPEYRQALAAAALRERVNRLFRGNTQPSPRNDWLLRSHGAPKKAHRVSMDLLSSFDYWIVDWAAAEVKTMPLRELKKLSA